MALVIAESELPTSLTMEQAVEAAYAAEMATVAGHLLRGLPCRIECDKELAPYLFVNLRSRLKDRGIKCLYLDGRPRESEEKPNAVPMGILGTMIAQLRDAVRGAI